MKIKSKFMSRQVYIVAFLVRMIILGYYWLTDSWLQADTDWFYRLAYELYSTGSAETKTFYDKVFLPLVFALFGEHISITLLINVMLGMCTLLAFEWCMSKLKISNRVSMILMWALAINPFFIQQNVIVCRDNIIYFLACLSFGFYMDYIQLGRMRSIVVAILVSLVGLIFHAEIVIFPVAYFIVWLLWDSESEKIRLVKWKIIGIIIVLMVIAGMFIAVEKYGFDSGKYIDKTVPIRPFFREGLPYLGSKLQLYLSKPGGSGYLLWMDNVNYLSLLPYTILRVIWFWLSPLPTEWRGILDVVSFAVDSLRHVVYEVLVVYYGYSNYDRLKYAIVEKLSNRKDAILMSSSVFIVLVSGLMFCWGVWNAGTAVRHRILLAPFELMVIGWIISKKTIIGGGDNRRK